MIETLSIEYNINKDKAKTQEVEKPLKQQQEEETTVRKEVISPSNRRKRSNPIRRENGDRRDSGIIEIE